MFPSDTAEYPGTVPLAGSEGYGACFNDVVAAHLMSLSRGFCACIMVYSVFNVR